MIRWGGYVTALVLVARVASADDAPPPDPLAIQIHGFVSQGALLTSDNNYLARDEHGSLEFTEAGINFTKPLDDQLTVGVQLFARDLGPDGNYSAKFDWLDLDYHWKDWLGFRAGRVKIPFGLYNDTSDIDAVQPVALLPQSVYSITNRNFLLAQTGVELYGYRPLGDAGALDYSAYLGSLYLTLDDANGIHFTNVTVPYVTGGRVLWETPLEGLRLGASALAGEIDATYVLNAAPTLGDMDATLFQINYLASAEYSNNGFLFAAEYGRSHAHSTAAGVTQREILEAMYGLASYHWRPWLQTTAYYSLLYPNVDNRSGRENHQHDAALSFRFDITPHWLVKLEGHAMRGTAALSSDLNGGVPIADLVNVWYLLAAKTTVYF
jgi:hypothetical protein